MGLLVLLLLFLLPAGPSWAHQACQDYPGAVRTSAESLISEPSAERARSQRHSLAFDPVRKEYAVVFVTTAPIPNPTNETTDGVFIQWLDEDGKKSGNAARISPPNVRGVSSPVIAYNSRDEQFAVLWEHPKNHVGPTMDVYGTVIGAAAK
jgi:hypothetical protein